MTDEVRKDITGSISTTELKEIMDKWVEGPLAEVLKELPTMSYDEAALLTKFISEVFEQASVKWNALDAFEWNDDVREQ